MPRACLDQTSLCLSLLLALQPITASQCETKSSEARNSDGSHLRLLHTQCKDNNSSLLQVEIKTAEQFQYKKISKSIAPLKKAKILRGNLIDIDGDGLYEVEEVLSCGAGPNCFRRIYKIDKKTLKSHPFFEGSYFEFRKIENFYVATGRSSCCSWVHQIYSQPNHSQPITKQHLSYFITVGADSGIPAKTRCLVSKRMGDRWILASLPNQKLLSLCAFFGSDYQYNPPGAQAGP